MSLGIGKIGPSYNLSRYGDLSFVSYFLKQCFIGNIQGNVWKNCLATFISEESRLSFQHFQAYYPPIPCVVFVDFVLTYYVPVSTLFISTFNWFCFKLVMILGVLLARKRYPLIKYLCVMLIVCGVALFMYKEVRNLYSLNVWITFCKSSH